MRPEKAIQMQKAMAEKVIQVDTFSSTQLLGGADVSNNLYDPAQMIYAAVVVLSKDFQVIEKASCAQKQSFPYIPGLLGFREAPALIEAYGQLKQKPDILMVDGHGISHPRGLGIASHVGVLLDIPTIGVAKSILVGEPVEKGNEVPLVWKGKVLGMVLRTKARSNPLIISVGHKISLQTAVKIVKNSLKGYKLPEPTRFAHLAANECRLTTA